MRQAFIGVDVGTSSARAGVFDEAGTLLSTARHPIAVWHDAGDIVEQSSSDIWAACVASVRAAATVGPVPADLSRNPLVNIPATTASMAAVIARRGGRT